jgi:type I restriction enzyme M protein
VARRVRTGIRAESRARYYIREQAKQRGWNVNHLASGGQFLEENEITAFFPDINLRLEKPDFLMCLGGEPIVVVEAKNDANKIDEAISQGIDYANQINASDRYKIKIVVGAAGEQDTGFIVSVRYLSTLGWVPLKALGFELTTVPSVREIELALGADDGTTIVSIPNSHEFIDAAIELSSILRTAKVEAPLRPKVIGAIVTALYQGKIDVTPAQALDSIHSLVEQAVKSSIDINEAKKSNLIDGLRLSGADFHRLAASINRVVAILGRLNVRSVLHTDTDFLGMFYEAFLRYGYDNNALGIVFTPRHITRFCVDLVGATPSDRVIDIASGTGGFLVAAYDTMISTACSQAAIDKVKSSLYGFDTNPTVWALATLNMFFRGDGKSHIEYGSCFEQSNRDSVRGRFTRAFLNPPFSQEGEPERDFISAAMDALEPEGLLAAVVYAGIFADDENKNWRREFLRRHTLLGMISLPEDLFYPTAAPTSIIIARAHIPLSDTDTVMMARIWNDGFVKLKNRRVQTSGSQLSEIKTDFEQFIIGQPISSALATTIPGTSLHNGQEWSPQQWLPQPHASEQEIGRQQTTTLQAIYQAVAQFPDLADEALSDFSSSWSDLAPLPLTQKGKVSDFFTVVNGKSTGEKNYADGALPYVSSGDTSNSIVRLVTKVAEETFEQGGLTVTAFGTAAIQPWPFMARGNGGSSVRVLLPKYNMNFRELAWFAAQINIQRWRFFYARMSIKSRIERLEIESPPARLPDRQNNVSANINAFRDSLLSFSQI